MSLTKPIPVSHIMYAHTTDTHSHTILSCNLTHMQHFLKERVGIQLILSKKKSFERRPERFRVSMADMEREVVPDGRALKREGALPKRLCFC